MQERLSHVQPRLERREAVEKMQKEVVGPEICKMYTQYLKGSTETVNINLLDHVKATTATIELREDVVVFEES